MMEVVVKRVGGVGQPSAVDEAVVNGLYEIDLYHSTMKTAGLIVAAAALGAAHARGESPSEWPTFDGITGRTFWQRVAGWSDEEYAEVVKQAKERSALGHATIILEYSGRASTYGQNAHGKMFNTQVGSLYTVEVMGAVMEAINRDIESLSGYRAELVGDAESSTLYSAVKYELNLKLAADDDYFVYISRDDDKVRLNHRALDRKAWSVKSPVWHRIMPPNGFRCRCTVVRRSKQWVIENIGKDAIRSTVPMNGRPDRGFSNSPRQRNSTDWSKYRPTHVSALMRTSR